MLKKKIRLGCIGIVLCLSVLFLSACSSLIKLHYEDGLYIDKKNSISYQCASVSYEPIAVGREYAKYEKTILHEISNLPPTQWLTEAYDGIGSVYYADTVTLPTLRDFDAREVAICVAKDIVMQMGKVEKLEDVQAIITALETGEDAILPQDGINSYQLKFTSSTYAGLYYTILYVEGSDSRNYLYDRGTKKCVEVGRLLKTYLPSTEDLLTETTIAEGEA